MRRAPRALTGLLLAAGLVLAAGCASLPPPDAELDAAQQAVARIGAFIREHTAGADIAGHAFEAEFCAACDPDVLEPEVLVPDMPVPEVVVPPAVLAPARRRRRRVKPQV